MGAYDFMVNAIQSGKISALEERIQKLERDLKIAAEWVKYFDDKIKELEKKQ